MTYGPRNTPPENHPRREAIPWCTTHHQNANIITWSVKEAKHIIGGCNTVRYSDECYEDTTRCVVSLGGPDHKWWKDT